MAEQSFLKTLEERALGKKKAAGNKSLGIRQVELMSVTAEELQTAIDSNPNHPVAKVYANALAKLKSKGKKLTIESPDMIALLRNHTSVLVKSSSENGQHTITKTVEPVAPPQEPTEETK